LSVKASSAGAAIRVTDNFVPEVGLIDIGMLEMGDCELARRMRADALA
jgi:CheY-like chemotaxis protein